MMDANNRSQSFRKMQKREFFKDLDSTRHQQLLDCGHLHHCRTDIKRIDHGL